MKAPQIYLIIALSFLPAAIFGQEKGVSEIMYEAIYH
jgi:hypothetical protein